MPRRRVRLAVAAGLLVLAAAPLRAQHPLPAVVRVHVTDATGAPIVRADVAILDESRPEAVAVATTDSTGRHTFSIVPRATRYRVTVRKVGYLATTRRLLVSPGDTTAIELRIAGVPTATQLPTVVTRETYRVDRDPGFREGFAQRCRAISVSCITEDSLVTRPNDLDHFFNQVPELIHVASSAALPAQPMMYGATGGVCTPTFYVDGFRWSLSWKELAEAYGPRELTGIEVYPTGKARPMRWAGDPTCGVVVFWTK